VSTKRIEDIGDTERLQLLINGVVDYAIYLMGPDGRILSWNSGAKRLKGYDADEVLGRPYSIFFAPEDQDVPGEALAKAAAHGRCETEGWRVRKDGSRFWAHGAVDAIRGDDGQTIGFAKVTRDITERMNAQNALKETQEQLAASQKMEAIGQLSGGIAHDFNNLLMIVTGNIESAQKHARQMAGAGNIQRALANAMRGAQRAAALTSRLLAFSRRQPLNPKPLDVNKFLPSTADFLQRSLGELVDVEVVGSAGLWQVEVDANQLEAALLNLAINARDAMPQGGKLTLEAANVFADADYCRVNPELSPGQYVVICVSDTGHGMSAEVMSRAFEPFFTTKEFGQGTGLGLSQVYGFVKQSDGHIKIYSELGQGTTIKIYLPRYSGSIADTDEGFVEQQAHTATGENILVVEDDNDVRAYLTEVLRGLGYKVSSAANAELALKLMEDPDKRIDLLLTDIVMPGKNGRQLAEEAQRARPDLPVLYMTGYSRNAVVHQGRLDKGVDLLQKPVTQAELAERVRNIFDRRTK
jgi:PAS domain S-box-containing protein